MIDIGTNMFTGKEILKIINGAKIPNDVNADFTINSVLTDSRADCSGALFLALVGENFDGHDYLDKALSSGALALCISAKFANSNSFPGSVPVIIVEDTLFAYQLLARHHREKINCKVIGITGSSGKTSTKEIVKAILVHTFGSDAVLATEGNTNNHIGVPQNLLKLNSKHRFAVIEMGTNHPGEIEVLAKTALPDIAVISSIGNVHIEFFGSTDGVAKEKSAIFAGYPDSSGKIKPPIAVFPAQGEGNQILRDKAGLKFYTFADKDCTGADLKFEYLEGNLHGSSFRLICNKTNSHTHSLSCDKSHYGGQDDSCSFAQEIELRRTSSEFSDSPISAPPQWSESIHWHLQGAHQASNAAAAALAALLLEVSEYDIESGIKKCSLPGMRMNISEKNGVTWINDAYNANPDSVKATLDWLAEFANLPNVKIVLGDMLEIGESTSFFHKQVLEYALKKLPQTMIFGVGKEMSKVVSTDPEHKKQITCFINSEIAAKELQQLISNGDMVFLKGSRGIELEKIVDISLRP